MAASDYVQLQSLFVQTRNLNRAEGSQQADGHFSVLLSFALISLGDEIELMSDNGCLSSVVYSKSFQDGRDMQLDGALRHSERSRDELV